MGLLGILVALGLLIWLAYRGWSILLLAPAGRRGRRAFVQRGQLHILNGHDVRLDRLDHHDSISVSNRAGASA